jgi:hypothetical protein
MLRKRNNLQILEHKTAGQIAAFNFEGNKSATFRLQKVEFLGKGDVPKKVS